MTEIHLTQPQAEVTSMLMRGRNNIGPLEQGEVKVNNTLLAILNQYSLGDDMTRPENLIGARNFLMGIGAFLYFPKLDAVELMKQSKTRSQFRDSMEKVFESDFDESLQLAYPNIRPAPKESRTNLFKLWEYNAFSGIDEAWGTNFKMLPEK